ncbi:hypothetical protein HRR83_006169 [Exophiala dermatitidis]|uniref:Uncharacterized protein n=1 Tax=Exophiala dermatitidis TaxID=5970 RepID=A0AAN6ENV0_EXODE|nr:hypothetical protein HRR74_005565 [Exophiala dermatitidis]KAJ4517593.1 hypothetical protein HRR73_004645 [Exophiala dermatitidis]KAJ4548649.1 hypothetical protein HRR76_001238 [Exophiala dermatitidis]KAJ4552631.1 hypothetical protein HRR77_002632 [Exophiala dermatitidis]KAJ4567132.1 hypothetical protein HRR81_007208 [Exophiala dermatitidis]
MTFLLGLLTGLGGCPLINRCFSVSDAHKEACWLPGGRSPNPPRTPPMCHEKKRIVSGVELANLNSSGLGVAGPLWKNVDSCTSFNRILRCGWTVILKLKRWIYQLAVGD